MSNYSREELSKARFDFEDIPPKMDILIVMPGLVDLDCWGADFSAWGGDSIVNRNCVFRYINLFYSKELQVFREAHKKDISARKAECAKYAGFYADPETLQFKPEVKRALEGKNEIVNRMIVSFIRHNYDTLYSNYITSLELLHRLQLDMLNSVKAPDVSDAQKLAKFGAEVEAMRLDLLSDDKHGDIGMHLLMVIEEDKLKLSPEARAKLTGEGKSPLRDFDYYAEGYRYPE